MIERAALSLAEREAIIERGLSTFMEVGEQLLAIREERSYREQYGTFEGYCRERWGVSRVQAHRLIEASEVVSALPMGNGLLPKNERQARELARIPDPEQRAEVWQRVTERHGERVTAQHIRELRSEESPSYDAGTPLLSIVDVETGEVVPAPDPATVIDIPDVRERTEEERTFDQLLRMSMVTKLAPEAVAEAAATYHTGSARMYLSRAETLHQWHERFVKALGSHLSEPLRRVK